MTEPKRILVVDNEKIIADTLVLIMRKHGFVATACYNGPDAIERALTFRPDLLVADYDIPFLNGIETAPEVRSLQPACRFLFLSAFPDLASIYDHLSQKTLEFACFKKPISPRALLDHVDDALKAA